MGALVQLPTESYQEILDHLPVATYLVDAARRIVLWNDACEALTGHRREEVLGHFCANDLLAHCDESCVPRCGGSCPIMETMRDGRLRQMDLFLRHKDGHRVPVRVRAAPVRDEHGAIVGACESMDERPMSLPAGPPAGASPGTSFDPVTELPPRYILLDRLAAEVQAFGGERVPFGVLALTIDNFSGLCATGGSMGAGRVLRATARTMCRLVGVRNLVGRWDDGVFLAILHGCSEASLLASAITLQRLAGMEAVPWWGDFLTITLSAGGTVVHPGDTVQELVRRVEEALQQAIQMGANQTVVA